MDFGLLYQLFLDSLDSFRAFLQNGRATAHIVVMGFGFGFYLQWIFYKTGNIYNYFWGGTNKEHFVQPCKIQMISC